jgi:spermidine/putrescine transport system permease protein
MNPRGLRGFVALSYLWYAMWFVAPGLIMLVYSIGQTAGLTQSGLVNLSHLGFSNYHAAIAFPAGPVLEISLENAGLATLLCGLIAYPVAYFIATKLKPRMRTLTLLLVVLPFWTDYLLRMLGWRIFLSPIGLLYSALHGIGLNVAYLSILDSRVAVMLGLVYNYLPLFILPLAVVLERIDPQLRQAADDLGASPRSTFRTVTFPLSIPGIVAGSVLVFVPMLGDYVTPTLLGGAKGLMFGNLIASEFTVGQNWSLGAAMSIVLVLILVGIVAACGVLAMAIRAGVVRARRRIMEREMERELALA